MVRLQLGGFQPFYLARHAGWLGSNGVNRTPVYFAQDHNRLHRRFYCGHAQLRWEIRHRWTWIRHRSAG